MSPSLAPGGGGATVVPCPRGQEGECFKRTRSPPFGGGMGRARLCSPTGWPGDTSRRRPRGDPPGHGNSAPGSGGPLPAAGFAAVAQSPEASLVPRSRRPNVRGRAALPERPPPADAMSQLHVCLPPCDTQRGTGDRVQGAPRDECHTGMCDLPPRTRSSLPGRAWTASAPRLPQLQCPGPSVSRESPVPPS